MPRRFVKQSELRAILDQRLVIATLTRQLATEADVLIKAEALVLHAVDIGTPTEPGSLDAAIVISETRRPSYKEALAARCGPRAIEEVIMACVPTATPKLVIMEGGRVVKSS